ncbi:DNA (cytosine-5-)-methyltransferase [Pedobacter sp. PF22-3]|uniref:DNA cytosine methyltransferase n=1 Tax=Pedobacter sp. PF22-3 TaxID=2994467 RepID=UPI002245ABCC|nr:DNA (cytosine-5-)-methyltransferase [Pedobacter sp. PF22-3]MCX2495908.1 DNA (cytosine-5-)-methyltransferase [Pedobacter sp. PF22-3]
MNNKNFNYIDLFAGAGGLSEGFKRSGFEAIAHVEMDKAACYTLKTRIAYYHLKENNRIKDYIAYLEGKITREELYSLIPSKILDTVINLPIGLENNETIFSKLDKHSSGREIDLIVGGPPCQAYSLAGRSRSKDKMVADPRNYLFLQYANYLQKYNPKMFVFENVLGLKSANEGRYFKTMVTLFSNLGYEIADFILEADKHGVLQKRKRIILIGHKRHLKLNVPDFESFEIKAKVSDIFADLPSLNAGEGVNKYASYKCDGNPYVYDAKLRNGIEVLTQHVCRPNTKQDKEIYKIAVELWLNKNERLQYDNLPDNLKTHKNRTTFCDRFKVVAPELESSQTVVAHIAKDGHYYIHPDIHQNRSISVREAARLQSFPDDFYFEGVKEGTSRTAAFKQIGNAVPPLMAERIAIYIKRLLQA